MRRFALLCLASTVTGCDRADRADRAAAADSTATPAAALAGPAGFAGRWTMSAVRERSDISYVTYELTATRDTSGWTALFPDRAPMAARVLVLAGDSVVVEIGPYPSVVRPGVTVMAHTVARLVDGKLEGRFDAHYRTAGRDSLVTGRLEGARAP